MFLIPNTAVIGPGDPIVAAAVVQDVHYEGELAVVICRLVQGRAARAGRPRSCYGYTCANDVTARDVQQSDGQWARAKGFDTLVPARAVDRDRPRRTSDLRITTRLDGETVQDGRTSQMVFDVADLVAYVSSAFTLLPGDVILTGTPAGVGPVARRPAGRGRDRGPRHAVEPLRAPLTSTYPGTAP